MKNIITAEYVNQIQFYQMPKVFFQESKYMPMRNESKLAYMLLIDLLPLSVENNWINENNEVFVKLSRSKIMELLNIRGTQKIAQVMKELVDYGLIIYKRVGLTKCNEIYICIPDTKCENQPLDDSKTSSPEMPESNPKAYESQTHIKTNITKTNNTKTNISQSINQRAVQAESNIKKETDRRTEQLKDEQTLVNDLQTVHHLLENQIHIDYLKQVQDPEFVEEIANNICEMYLSENTRIGSQNKPQSIIRGVISKLQMVHIEHVIEQFDRATAKSEIYNPKRYLQTLIYNSIYEARAKMKGHIKYHLGY